MVRYVVISPTKWIDVCAENHITQSHIMATPNVNPIEINTIIKSLFRADMDDTPIALHVESFVKLLKTWPAFENAVIGKVEEDEQTKPIP